jgi:hypothetical protein
MYSQGTEAEGGIFSDLSGGHENVENMWVYTPKGLRLRVEYSLTCLEVMIMWRICGFILPRDWGLQRGEYFLTCLEVMNVKNIWVYTPNGLRVAERGVFSDQSGGYECEEYISSYVLPRDW